MYIAVYFKNEEITDFSKLTPEEDNNISKLIDGFITSDLKEVTHGDFTVIKTEDEVFYIKEVYENEVITGIYQGSYKFIEYYKAALSG